jgi:hypothetical protein
MMVLSFSLSLSLSLSLFFIVHLRGWTLILFELDRHPNLFLRGEPLECVKLSV